MKKKKTKKKKEQGGGWMLKITNDHVIERVSSIGCFRELAKIAGGFDQPTFGGPGHDVFDNLAAECGGSTAGEELLSL